MYTLAFDTTGSFCSIILLKDGAIAARKNIETDFGQAEILMGSISSILKNEKINFKDITLTAVCTGPGSFTGVRSSIAAARAFALACPQSTVCGISAFEAYMHALPEKELAEVNAVLIETKREDYYVQYFDKQRNKILPPATERYEDIIHFLQGKKVTFTGDGIQRFLSRPSGLSLHAVNIASFVPIEALAECAIQKFEHKTTDFPKPVYLKAPDICVK